MRGCVSWVVGFLCFLAVLAMLGSSWAWVVWFWVGVGLLGLMVVGFFAGQGHGLSPELRIAADDFVDVTGHLVGSWQGLYQQRDQQAVIAAKRAAQVQERSE